MPVAGISLYSAHTGNIEGPLVLCLCFPINTVLVGKSVSRFVGVLSADTCYGKGIPFLPFKGGCSRSSVPHSPENWFRFSEE